MNERKVFIDYVRVLCMCFVVCVLHLSQYLNNDPIDYYLWHNPVFFKITYSALGAFSFISGYLMGGVKSINRHVVSTRKDLLEFTQCLYSQHFYFT